MSVELTLHPQPEPPGEPGQMSDEDYVLRLENHLWEALNQLEGRQVSLATSTLRLARELARGRWRRREVERRLAAETVAGLPRVADLDGED